MDFMDKKPSKMQGQVFFEAMKGGQHFSVWLKKKKSIFLSGAAQGITGHGPHMLSQPTPLPLKVRRQRFNIRHFVIKFPKQINLHAILFFCMRSILGNSGTGPTKRGGPLALAMGAVSKPCGDLLTIMGNVP